MATNGKFPYPGAVDADGHILEPEADIAAFLEEPYSRHRTSRGGFLPMFMTIGKLNSSNGYCAVIRDITQWKRTEEELRNAKRAAETANAR